MAKKKKSSSFWDNKIVWAILALCSSILLWVYVTMTEGDLIPETYPGVQVVFSGADTLREKEGLIITDVSATTVSVSLKGTRREVSNLTPDMITAVFNVASLVSEVNITDQPKITFATGINESTLSDIVCSPSTISFSVVRENYRTIELREQFNGSVAEGFVGKSVVFNPETITISGPESETSKVAYALVVIERQDIDRTLNFDSEYTLMDAEGNKISLGNMRVSHETVNVTFNVSAKKEVPLTVDVVPGAGATAENIQITCEPATIEIEGNAEILSGINKISLGTVDLASFPLTEEFNFPIVLDNDVTNVTGITEAKVTIQVIGLEIKKFSVTNIEVINVTSGYSAAIITEAVEVSIRGPADILEQIKANNIRIVANVAELGEAKGEFEPEARVYVDGFTGVGAVGKYKVFVKIS